MGLFGSGAGENRERRLRGTREEFPGLYGLCPRCGGKPMRGRLVCRSCFADDTVKPGPADNGGHGEQRGPFDRARFDEVTGVAPGNGRRRGRDDDNGRRGGGRGNR